MGEISSGIRRGAVTRLPAQPIGQQRRLSTNAAAEPMAWLAAKTSAGGGQSAVGMQSEEFAPAACECQVVKDGVRIREAAFSCRENSAIRLSFFLPPLSFFPPPRPPPPIPHSSGAVRRDSIRLRHFCGTGRRGSTESRGQTDGRTVGEVWLVGWLVVWLVERSEVISATDNFSVCETGPPRYSTCVFLEEVVVDQKEE